MFSMSQRDNSASVFTGISSTSQFLDVLWMLWADTSIRETTERLFLPLRPLSATSEPVELLLTQFNIDGA